VRNIKNMIPFMISADIAICNAGMTLFELACLGTPTIIICGEMFEEETSAYMENYGFGINLGFGKGLKEHTIFQSVQNFIIDHKCREIMSKRGKEIIDGAGSDRIIEILIQSIEKSRNLP